MNYQEKAFKTNAVLSIDGVEVGRAIPFDLDVPKRPCHVLLCFKSGAIHGFDSYLIDDNRLDNLNEFTLELLAFMEEIPYRMEIFPYS